MRPSLFEKHKHCEVFVNWDRTNAGGQPALCCANCLDRKGKPQYLDWLSKTAVNMLDGSKISQQTEIYENKQPTAKQQCG